MNFRSLCDAIGNLFYEQVSCRLFPRQKWLTSMIPRTFCDVDFLIEEANFECLIHYWEYDDGKEMMQYAGSMYDNPSSFIEDGMTMEEIEAKKIEAKEMYHTIWAAYEWASHRHYIFDQLTDKLVKAHANEKWREVADEFHKKEQEFIDNDTKHLMTIVKYRKYLWS